MILKKMILPILIFAIFFSACSKSTSGTDFINPSFYDLPVKLDYRDALFGDIEMDKPVVFTGKISQIISDDELIIQTGCVNRILWKCIEYEKEEVVLSFPIIPKILVNDYVTVFGRYKGSTKRVFSVLLFEEERRVPQFEVDYYRINNGRLYDAHSGQYVDGDFVKIDTGEVNDIGMAKYKVVFKTYAEMEQIKAQEAQERAEAEAKAEKKRAEAEAKANAEAKKKNSAARALGTTSDHVITKQNSKGVTIYCTWDGSICKTEKEVAAYRN